MSFLLECMSAVPGARLVVKTHPLDSEKNEAALQAIIGTRGTVVSDIHPHTLIEAADCVSVRTRRSVSKHRVTANRFSFLNTPNTDMTS